jgi:hypothetical protein
MLGLRQIGVDFRYPICLDLKSDGRVVEIDPRKGKIRLINSRVEYFGVFILLHQLTIDQGKNSDAGTRRRLTVSLEESMIAIDAVALADGDWFWATFLEEMKLMS